MDRISVRMDDEMLERVSKLIGHYGFKNQSDIVRSALKYFFTNVIDGKKGGRA